ncbi:16S rRNA (uracil(1498)-N(3))-methyltransferase [bacterium]|nr:16S rRNA (uracil(1498)-N(3))-methyltransferase [bacterium]
MRQLVLPGDRSGDARFALDAKTSRYLLKVLRLGRGDAFPAIDGEGHAYSCTIEEDAPGAAVIALSPIAGSVLPASATSEAAAESAGFPRIALIQCLPKGPKLDLIIRQAVEAGVEAVFPLQTRYCVVRERGEKEIADKLERRRAIVREALQQSGSAVRTRILPASTMATLPAALASEGFAPEASLCLMFHERPLAEKSLHEYCAGEPRPTALLIGPEGGFAPEETEAFAAMGFRAVHFDGAILRTETAALYAIAAVKTILMERASWTASK